MDLDSTRFTFRFNIKIMQILNFFLFHLGSTFRRGKKSDTTHTYCLNSWQMTIMFFIFLEHTQEVSGKVPTQGWRNMVENSTMTKNEC